MSFQLTGTIYKIGGVEQVSDKFCKRELVIVDSSSKYPQHIPFQVTQERCQILDTLKVGQGVTVFFNLRGRLWVDNKGVEKCFGTNEVWKITAATQANAPQEERNLSVGNSEVPF